MVHDCCASGFGACRLHGLTKSAASGPAADDPLELMTGNAQELPSCPALAHNLSLPSLGIQSFLALPRPVTNCMQTLQEKIDGRYRVNLLLDNLPVTVQDLKREVRVVER